MIASQKQRSHLPLRHPNCTLSPSRKKRKSREQKNAKQTIFSEPRTHLIVLSPYRLLIHTTHKHRDLYHASHPLYQILGLLNFFRRRRTTTGKKQWCRWINLIIRLALVYSTEDRESKMEKMEKMEEEEETTLGAASRLQVRPGNE